MKPFRFLLVFLTLALGLLAASAAVYQCPMHPWIKSDKPGDKCTICGMDLVAVPAADTATAADPNQVTLSPAAASVVGVKTTAVHRGVLVRTLRVSGVIEDDDTRHRILSARVPGRVEKLFVNYVGAEVREGEPLATIYSPEILTAEREYVQRLKAGDSFPVSERASTRERLLDLGLAPEDIDALERSLKPTALINLRAPMTGTVVARHVYEGQQLNKDQSEQGTRLFEIGDFSTMWFVFDAYEHDLGWLKVGQDVGVTLTSLPGRVLTAPIAFINPNLNEQTRTAMVRVVLPNEDRSLRHKQTASGAARLEIPGVLLAPRSAVLQHGAEPVVFLEQKERTYLARRVTLGRVGDTEVEILGGLQDGDRVVTEGGLLLDGQAQLARAAITEGAPPSTPPAIGHAVTGDSELKSLAFAAADAASLLAADDFATYHKQLPALRAALQAFLTADAPSAPNRLTGSLKDGLRDATDLPSARRDFEPFSTALADLVRERQLTQRAGLHIFQCPMSPVLGTGRWLSRTSVLKNPFFGSAMPDCGAELNEDQP